jgi:hypothetical protein
MAHATSSALPPESGIAMTQSNQFTIHMSPRAVPYIPRTIRVMPSALAVHLRHGQGSAMGMMVDPCLPRASLRLPGAAPLMGFGWWRMALANWVTSLFIISLPY